MKERGGTEEGEEQARKSKMESRQEVATPQALSQFDVTKEVSKEELPVCVPPSFSAEQKPSILEEQQDGVIQVPESKKEREEDLVRENYIFQPQPSSSFSSPSPLLRYAQPTMSRIYNLKPVTSRAGVCVTERNLDVQTHGGGIIKSRPGGQVASGAQRITADVSSLRSVQRRVEQLRLKDQEVSRQGDGEVLQKPKVCQDENINMQKDRTNVISKPSSEPRVQTQLPQISTSTTESKNTQTEPNVTTPSTRLFTIRSASGGPGKRGTTFTITPRKTGPSVTPPSSDTTPKVPSSSDITPKVPSSSDATPKVPSPSSSGTTPSVVKPKAPSNTPEPSKTRYPTAEEIEVIGGYQNLERSCLVKNRASSKMAKVCFNESQLDCVHTYPSEESVVKEEGNIQDWNRTEEKKEENDEEDDDEDGAGSGIKRMLRVDESCPRLSFTPKLDSASQNALRHVNMAARDSNPQLARSRINTD